MEVLNEYDVVSLRGILESTLGLKKEYLNKLSDSTIIRIFEKDSTDEDVGLSLRGDSVRYMLHAFKEVLAPEEFIQVKRKIDDDIREQKYGLPYYQQDIDYLRGKMSYFLNESISSKLFSKEKILEILKKSGSEGIYLQVKGEVVLKAIKERILEVNRQTEGAGIRLVDSLLKEPNLELAVKTELEKIRLNLMLMKANKNEKFGGLKLANEMLLGNPEEHLKQELELFIQRMNILKQAIKEK